VSDALIRTLAITFALHPGMAARLLSEHRDDGSGRCRVCAAGPQGIRQRWPCQIAWYARRAAELDEESRARTSVACAAGPGAGFRSQAGSRPAISDTTRS
jgi:hypothetical protein